MKNSRKPVIIRALLGSALLAGCEQNYGIQISTGSSNSNSNSNSGRVVEEQEWVSTDINPEDVPGSDAYVAANSDASSDSDIGDSEIAGENLNVLVEVSASPSPSASVVVADDSEEDTSQAGETCRTIDYQQPAAQITNKLDILFVTDTSGSLSTEKGEIADQLDAFLGELPADLDYQVGVMLAHGSTSSYSGKLYRHNSEPRVLSSKSLSLSQIQSHLRTKFVSARTDYNADGGEEALYSLNKGLQSSNYNSAVSQGFYRSGAALAVIFIADENDICAVYPTGVSPVYDGDHLEAPAFTRDCSGISPEGVVQALQNVKGNDPLVVSGILYNDRNNVPVSGENEYGWGYMETIALANGQSANLGDNDFRSSLSFIGRNTQTKLNLKSEFDVASWNVTNSSGISVTVDGHAVAYTYVQALGEVQIQNAGSALSQVHIQYCQSPQ